MTGDRLPGSRHRAASVLGSLPVHPSPGAPAEEYRLLVDGLVREPVSFTLSDLRALAARTVDEDFECLEGWVVPDQHWRGVPLAHILQQVGVLPKGNWVQASSGNFGLPLEIERAFQAVVALDLNGAVLPHEHGWPARLVVPGGECFTSIKWLDHLEVCSAPGENSAESIARQRLKTRPV